jgi:hypothetical protein
MQKDFDHLLHGRHRASRVDTPEERRASRRTTVIMARAEKFVHDILSCRDDTSVTQNFLPHGPSDRCIARGEHSAYQQ